MKPTPLAPVLPDQSSDRPWSFAVSAVVHALLILGALGLVLPRRPPIGSAAPSYDLVFDGPSGSPTADTNAVKTQPLPPAQPADIPPPPDAVQGIPAPTPLTTPDPAATGSPPPAAETAPPPTAIPPPTAAPAPAPAATTAVPPPVALAPPDEAVSIPTPTLLEVPPITEPPAVRLQLPPAETAAVAPQPIMPQPPPPLPPLEPRPPMRPTPRSPAPRPSLGTLSNPMDLSLAPSAPRPAARGSVASRAIDLSPPAERQGPLKSDAYADIRAANASADWNRGLLAYWLRHRYYPDQAAMQGDEGTVTLQLTVNRSGKVESVEVVSRSGSQWLDMAALGTWRGAQLPPFTNEMREDRITFPIPIRYYLIRR